MRVWIIHAIRSLIAAAIMGVLMVVFGFGCAKGVKPVLGEEILSSVDDLETPPVDGAALYGTNCASCHGPLATSAKRGRSAVQITNALSTIPNMQTLHLTAIEVSAIAGVLADEPVESCLAQSDPGHVPVHKINKEEYNNVVASLFGISGRPGDSLPDDNTALGFNNIAAVLTVSPTSVDRYLAAAENAVNLAFTTNAAGIFNCDGATVSPSAVSRACAEQILTRMAQAAFRRPATEAELLQAKSYLDLAAAEGQSLQEGVRWGLEWMLVTPSFLYRTIQHPSPDNSKAVKSLSGYELANRLSFFLWSSKPDQALLDAAADGSLTQTDVLEAQVTRMLADPKAQALIHGFSKQWLGLHKFEQHSVDTSVYAFSENLRQDMMMETNLLLRDVFMGSSSPISLLTSDSAYLNRRLASHYGLSGPTSDTNYVKTSLVGTERRGLLGQGSILTQTSISNRTSIVRRGKWILDNVLCEPPSDPPGNVNTGDLDSNSEGSIRARLEAHRADPVCASCHNKIDPPGFALESFDANGTARTSYRDGSAIDTSGVLPDGKSVAGALDLNEILKADPRFKVCISKKLLTYALGREVVQKDQCTINRFASDNVSESLPVSSLIKAIVTSDPFRKQTGEGSP